LIKNYPRLRAKFVPLSFEVLAEGPRIGKTSIPEWIRIKVGGRVFEVIRNAEKPGPDGNPIGPAMKHLGERAGTATESPTVRQLTDALNEQLRARGEPPAHQPAPVPKTQGAIDSQTDFPISSLAAALDQAEAQLIFQQPQSSAKPVNLD